MTPTFHYTLGTGTESWREQIALARRAGFSALDLDLREAAHLDPREVVDVLGEMVPSTGRLPVYPGQLLDPRVPAFCRAVGLRVLTCSVPPCLPIARDLLPEYQLWAARLAEVGIDLAIESLTPYHLRVAHPVPYVQTFAEYQEFVAAVGPNAGYLLDSWHWHHGGYPSPKGLPILHIHLADSLAIPATEVRDNERLFPGEGIVNLVGLLGDIGPYSKYVAAEVFGQKERFADGVSRARYGRETLERILASS